MPHGFKFVQSEERVAVEGPELRLTFRRDGERWTHALAVGSGSEPQGIAASEEGDATRDDPARVISPAYQDVQPQFTDSDSRLLLTGQSVPHHYSAVVTMRRVGDSFVVEFDVADRCRFPVDVLAATYLVRLGSSRSLVEASPDRIVWGGDELGQGRLEFTADAANSVALAEAGRRSTRVQALARIMPSTHTQRLLYRWRWTPSIPTEQTPVPRLSEHKIGFVRPS